MKGILTSICMASLTLALTAQGDQMQGDPNADVKARARHTTREQAARPASTRANAAVTSRRIRPIARSNVKATATVNRNNMRTERAPMRRTSERTVAVNRNRNVTINQNRNVTMNRNRVSFAEATTLHRQEFHNRDWWRRHFKVVIINNNAFFFDAGFWFPAWGYFPGAYYPYDGPIYAYDGLAPDQVVVNVQLQLRQDGYYAGPIDGVLGPTTQRALAAFQADHGLRITSAIDQATVSTLGLS